MTEIEKAYAAQQSQYVQIPQIRRQEEPPPPAVRTAMSRADQILQSARQTTTIRPARADQPARRQGRTRARRVMRRPAFLDDLPPLWGVDAAMAAVTLLTVIPILCDWQKFSYGIVINIAQVSTMLVVLGILALLCWLGWMAIRSTFRRHRW